MSELKVNKISPRSGTDVTLGDSGDTFTIPAGATLDTSNSTVTLPDSSISLAKLTATGTKDATTFLRGDNTFAEAGGGKILQVITATDETERSTSSTSFVTASNTLSVNITPSATSSKIYIISTFSGGNATNPSNSAYYTIFRDSTNLGNATNGMARARADISGTMGIIPISVSVLDSPNTTSSITYQIYLKTDSGNARICNGGSIKGSITAFEVSA